MHLICRCDLFTGIFLAGYFLLLLSFVCLFDYFWSLLFAECGVLRF